MRFLKELAVCFIIVLSIIFLDIIVSSHFETQKIEIKEIIDKLEDKLKQEEYDEELSSKLYEKWFALEKKASYYVEHDELEKVSLRISIVKKSTEIENKEEAINALEETKFLINHIYEKDKLKLKNIF